MKKTFLTLLIFTLTYFLTYSQDRCKESDTLIIQYNARTGVVSRYPTYEINQNGSIIFEVKDINLFRYSITLTEFQNNVINRTKLSEGNTQININPNVFNLTDLNLHIQFVPFTPNNKTKVLAEIKKEKADKEIEIKRKIQEIEKEKAIYLVTKGRLNRISEIDVKLLNIEFELSYLDSIKGDEQTKDQKLQILALNKLKREKNIEEKKLENIDTLKKLDEDYTILKEKLQTELDSLVDTLANIVHRYNKKVEDDESNNSKFIKFNSALKAYIQSLARLNELTDFYQRLINILYSDQTFDNIKIEKDKAARDVLQKDEISRDDILKYCYKKLRDIEPKFFDLSEAYSLVAGISGDKTANTYKTKEIFDKILAFNSQIKTSSYQSFFLQLAKLYDAINESNFTLKYQTLILSDNADLINFSLKAEPQSNLPSSVETKPINFKYNVKIIGGVKIDVSPGIFWNVGLNDFAYRFESKNDTSTLVIKEKNENLFIPLVGVLFNIYNRSNKNVKIGGNIGFSTNTERLNYYIGISLLIGKSERININVGVAGAQVNRVSDLYYSDKTLTIQVPIADLPNEVPLRNPRPFKIGAFFGISFNLWGTKNKETLSQIITL